MHKKVAQTLPKVLVSRTTFVVAFTDLAAYARVCTRTLASLRTCRVASRICFSDAGHAGMRINECFASFCRAPDNIRYEQIRGVYYVRESKEVIDFS